MLHLPQDAAQKLDLRSTRAYAVLSDPEKRERSTTLAIADQHESRSVSESGIAEKSYDAAG